MLELILSFILGILVTGLVAWHIALRRIRRHHQAQKNLLQRTRRAEKLAELGHLTGHLAHEIRNPLSTVNMNLKLLSEDIGRLVEESKRNSTDLNGEVLIQRYRRQLRKIDTIAQEAERVTHTLNDFLRYAGRIELHPARQNINEILDDLIDFYEPQAVNQGIQIRRSLAETAIFCRIDKDLMKQALLNLFINATQIMEDGGELMVRSAIKADTALLEVIDTGPGISPELQEKVFDPYYTTRAGGTGLGLPMCRRIIEEHQGELELDSEPGKGTRFVIKLPLVKD